MIVNSQPTSLSVSAVEKLKVDSSNKVATAKIEVISTEEQNELALIQNKWKYHIISRKC